MKGLNRLIQFLGLVVMAVAIYQEMQKPADERTWHGKVADFFPYDFRVPSMERVQSRLWDPDNPSVVVPTIFGVGWTLNFAQLYKMGQYFHAGLKQEA